MGRATGWWIGQVSWVLSAGEYPMRWQTDQRHYGRQTADTDRQTADTDMQTAMQTGGGETPPRRPIIRCVINAEVKADKGMCARQG